MAKQKYFDKFLSNIEPSKSTVDYISSVQTNLRNYLENHESYQDVHKDTFLSGSYAKHTCIRPVINDGKRDVDIVIVTNYTSEKDATEVLNELYDVLIEKDIYINATKQSHSIGIEMSGIDIDVVPVIEAEDEEKYEIGSTSDGSWTLTDPKGHKKWSTDVNVKNSGQYKPLVKIFKWWRRVNCPDNIKYPKGITLEKIIADNIADATQSTENLLVGTMQNIITAYKEDYVNQEMIPIIEDPTITTNDLMAGYLFDDFKNFIEKIDEHLLILNDEATANDIWRRILGNEFPSEETTQNSALEEANITMCLSVTHRQKAIWPLPKGNAAFVGAIVNDHNGNIIRYDSDSFDLPKGCEIIFTAICGVKSPFSVKWQVVNTGQDAYSNNCPRGGFEDSNIGTKSRKEDTAYTGKHYVQCFIIKRGVCVAKSKEFIINVN
jgi:hypothetical protein|nr:hypothetical protein [uncultured Lachnoclostridium sp.]